MLQSDSTATWSDFAESNPDLAARASSITSNLDLLSRIARGRATFDQISDPELHPALFERIYVAASDFRVKSAAGLTCDIVFFADLGLYGVYSYDDLDRLIANFRGKSTRVYKVLLLDQPQFLTFTCSPTGDDTLHATVQRCMSERMNASIESWTKYPSIEYVTTNIECRDEIALIGRFRRVMALVAECDPTLADMVHPIPLINIRGVSHRMVNITDYFAGAPPLPDCEIADVSSGAPMEHCEIAMADCVQPNVPTAQRKIELARDWIIGNHPHIDETKPEYRKRYHEHNPDNPLSPGDFDVAVLALTAVGYKISLRAGVGKWARRRNANLPNYVYFIVKGGLKVRSPDAPATYNVKIGRSSNPDRRVLELQTGQSNKYLRIIATIACDAFRVERALHRIHADKRGRGEWFRFTPDQLRDAVADAQITGPNM